MDYSIGDWVKLKTLNEIKERIREIEQHNEDCDWDEEEYDELDEDLESMCGKICVIEDCDDEDSSYEISIPNHDTYDTFWIHSDWVEPVKTYDRWVNPDEEQPKFKVGDEITITRYDANCPLYWNSNMDWYIGKTTIIKQIYPHGYGLENSGNWVWPETNLTSAIVYQPF